MSSIFRKPQENTVWKCKSLTTSTLCLPGGWGMEYLMKPCEGKGCRHTGNTNYYGYCGNLTCIDSLGNTFMTCESTNLGSVRSSCTRKSVGIKLRNKTVDMLTWEWNGKKNILLFSKAWKNDYANAPVPHYIHQRAQAVWASEQLWMEFSSEPGRNDRIAGSRPAWELGKALVSADMSTVWVITCGGAGATCCLGPP